jgi:FixJ family two-component response regulator
MQGAAQTVFIVDDAPEVRKSLSRLVAAAGYQVRAFESAEEFLAGYDGEAEGCLLLDIFMPGLNGIELQHELRGFPHALPIVFLTGVGDIQTSVGAMKEGAVDFLTKPIDSARLFAAVEEALRRDEEQRQHVAIRRVIRQRLDTLTPREREVMTHVIRGRLNKQIAAEMGAGEKTIKVHRARMMSKMGARSVAELVPLGLRVGMEIEPALGTGTTALSWRQPRCPNMTTVRMSHRGITLSNGGTFNSERRGIDSQGSGQRGMQPTFAASGSTAYFFASTKTWPSRP